MVLIYLGYSLNNFTKKTSGVLKLHGTTLYNLHQGSINNTRAIYHQNEAIDSIGNRLWAHTSQENMSRNDREPRL